jgi:hypothetical protein
MQRQNKPLQAAKFEHAAPLLFKNVIKQCLTLAPYRNKSSHPCLALLSRKNMKNRYCLDWVGIQNEAGWGYFGIFRSIFRENLFDFSSSDE